MAIYHCSIRMIGRSGGGNPVKALGYIAGTEITDRRTGEVFGFKDKSVQEVNILLPENAPQWTKDIQRLVSEDRKKGIQLLSDIVNAAEKRDDSQVYREIEVSLPRELTYEQNKVLAKEYIQDQFCSLGMLAIQSFHTEMDDETGELNPHCHTFLLTRELVEEGLATHKTREWNRKDHLETWREQWAQYASFHLKLHGYNITLDHRSYKDQGLDIEPQPKLGKRVKEQEKRPLTKDKSGEGLSKGKSFIETQPKTDRVQEFREVQLRNLYRILQRPEIVFEIVTRNHTTFMWGEVQKTLHRYVDSPELYQRLESRLKNSKELIMLTPEGVKKDTGRIEDRAIYTTHSLLKHEKALVKIAEILATSKSHAVYEASIEEGIQKTQARMEEEGHKLSEDQEKAIRHLVEEGQLKCIVGYAGAGKTTALETCREIWEDEEGYKVYGFAPTGRAEKNLEDSGIKSTTLHKFLKAYNEGRCHYGPKSILVLDEGGMVDVERFQKFLSIVENLGVKAVVVGDGAQLLPVEAGPAFRLVTERVGASRLEEIVRQKEAWQRDATVCFGQGDAKRAIQIYQERGHIHIVKENLPSGNSPEDVVKRYEMTARATGPIFREIVKEIEEKYPDLPNEAALLAHATKHEDYPLFKKYRSTQIEAGKTILDNADTYRPYLEARRLDPTEMARLFVNKNKHRSKQDQYDEVKNILKAKKLDHLIGVEKERGQGVEVRSEAKNALLEHWKQAYKEEPHKSMAIMAYSNRDVRDLNERARDHLKAEGRIGKGELTYTIIREVEDDFGRTIEVKEERKFSQGDRIVFTRNKDDLGVSNGTMGTILALEKNKIKVSLDKGKNLTFAPKMFPFFDQGWAITIHKFQGTTVNNYSFVLASHEMNSNLSYVSMTRHKENVYVYGSALDFWREEKVADILSKSGEKLGAADYLDANSLAALMKEEDKFIEKLLNRLSDQLYAMGAVTKEAFERVADRFFGRVRERDIYIKPETIREEQRAEELFRQALKDSKQIKTIQDVYEDMKHPAFATAKTVRKAFEKGLKVHGEEKAISYWVSKRESMLQNYHDKLAKVEKGLNSPLLSYLSDRIKQQGCEEAKQNPDKILKVLQRLKDNALERRDKLEALDITHFHKIEAEREKDLRRFKVIQKMLAKEASPSASLKEEYAHLGQKLAQDKVVMEAIKRHDKNIAKAIEKITQEQRRSIENERGGHSR